MKIQEITVIDTFGTEHAKFSPGTVTRIRGANGSGKSSILKALIYVFEGGTDPGVIRKGAEQSRIEMKLDDGTIITKVTRPKRARKGGEIVGYTTDLGVTQPDGEPKNAPKAFIEELSERLAVDPSVLLRIDATTVPGRKALAAELMKLMPITFTDEEIQQAFCKRPGAIPPDHSLEVVPTPKTFGLDELKKVSTAVTEQRRRIGITRDDAYGAVSRLQKSLPEDDGADYKASLVDAEQERLEIERAIADRRVEIERDKHGALEEARKVWTDTVAATNADIDAKIRTLEAERTTRNNAAKEQQLKVNQAVTQVAQDLLADLEKEAQPEQERVAAEISVLKEKIQASARADALRQEIDSQRGIMQSAARTYDRLSEVLQNLEQLRLDKLNDLPVQGLVVEDGEVYLDGIPWMNVNLARRVEAVLQICTQRAGKLSLLLIDDSEHLDQETRAAIEQGLAEAGFQVIEAIVEDGPLRIEQVSTVAA